MPRGLPCSDPYCRQAAEWRLPAGAVRQTELSELLFCFACADRFVGNVRKSEGLYPADAIKRALRSVRSTETPVSTPSRELMAELVVKFEASGKSIEDAVRLARKAVDEMGGAA